MLGVVLLIVLRLGGYELLSVQSNSMAPTIRRGNAVLVHMQRQQPVMGQVISYRSPVSNRVIVTHRVVAVDDRRGLLTTKGDNAERPDYAVPMANVLGRELMAIPLIGYALTLVDSPLGLLIAVYMPAAVIMAGEVLSAMRYYADGLPYSHVHYRLRPAK